MDLTKTELDVGYCIYSCILELQRTDERRITMTNNSHVEISITKRGDESYRLSLSYNDNVVNSTLKETDINTPLAWSMALSHRYRIVGFLDRVQFVDHDNDPACPFDKYGRSHNTPVHNTWSDMSNRLHLAISAAELIMGVVNLVASKHENTDIKWITPATALHLALSQNSIMLAHYESNQHPPRIMNFVFNTANTDAWRDVLIDTFLSWLSTGEWSNFMSLFITRISCINKDDMMYAENEISNRFKRLLNVNIPRWICSTERSPIMDAHILSFRTNDGNVLLLPLTKSCMHAPIFTEGDVLAYTQEYIRE